VNLEDVRQSERELCKRDVCMYCGGRALGYERAPVGPNSAGNWVHSATAAVFKNSVLCVASSIFARENYEQRKP
jgi:hypothetical protein